MHALSVCRYWQSILVSFLILCFIACLFSFIENTASLFDVGFKNIDWSCIVYWKFSFVIPSGVHIGSYFAHTSHSYQTRLVVSAGCTGASTLSQAEIYRPECSAQVALYSEKSHCTFASQYLASQHLYQLEVTDMYPALTSKWDMLGIVRNSQKQKRLYCTYIVFALLEIHLNSFYSHSVVAFSRLNVSMWI